MLELNAVIFDMDGVIFDSETMYINELIRFFKQHDIEIQVNDCIPLDESSIIIASSLFTFNSLIVYKYISGFGLLSLNCSPLTISEKYFLKPA